MIFLGISAQEIRFAPFDYRALLSDDRIIKIRLLRAKFQQVHPLANHYNL